MMDAALEERVALERFFERQPAAFPLFEAADAYLRREFPGVKRRVQKSQIAYGFDRSFAYLSLPYRSVKGRPDCYLILTFGLRRQLNHPRIAESVEPYPERWTHHTLVSCLEELDAQVTGWLQEAAACAVGPSRRRKAPGTAI